MTSKTIISLMVGLAIATTTFVGACNKKTEDTPAKEAAQENRMEEKSSESKDATEQKAEEAKSGGETQEAPKDAPEAEKPEPKGAEVGPTDVQAKAAALFDEKTPNFDFSKGCELIRTIDKYESPEMLYRRAWCDVQQALIVDDAVREETIARLKEAGEQDYVPALKLMVDQSLDNTGFALPRMAQIFRDRLEQNNAPETQYDLADALSMWPGEIYTKEMFELLEKSAKAGYIPAKAKLGSFWLDNEKKKAEALKMLEEAADGGNRDAILSLVSHHDYNMRYAENDKERYENTEKLLKYLKQSEGQILSCSVALSMVANKDLKDEQRAQAMEFFPKCVSAMHERFGCDRIRESYRDAALMSEFPENTAQERKSALIQCYKNVIRHGDYRPIIMDKPAATNEEIIKDLDR